MNHINKYFWLIVFVSLLLQTTSGWAKKQQKTDFISLAAMMIKDGHHDRALLALQSVNLEEEGVDLIRFYTLQGLSYMSLNDMVAAKSSFELAIKNGQIDRLVYVYLAQVNYALKDYSNAIKAINQTGEILKNYPKLMEMKAQSHWQLKQTG